MIAQLPAFGEFLQGTFNSDFANEGRMDLDLSRLWAVPVVQALFARLGFPTTAVFSRIEARSRIDIVVA